ncbi:hypothetical protein [Pseudonocardia humida]|uniref:hypothetical protein n=1 Tax=Pseudonocardia humida TaxID=2800819 RepID=UPI00207CC1A0|nr:hypothetical protein [Pseudonocardia humida]
MFPQQSHDRLGDADDPTAGTGLRVGGDSAGVHPLRAVPGRGVAAVARAAVPVARSLERPSDGEAAAVELDVRPLQPERLPLPQTESEGNGPAGVKSGLGRRGQNLLQLFQRHRLDLDFVQPGRLRDPGGVPVQVVPSDRFVQRRPHRAVRLVRRTG